MQSDEKLVDEERVFIVFCHDYRSGGMPSITPDMKIRLGTREIVDRMSSLLQYPDNFLGIVDDFGKTLQFVVNDDLSTTAELVVEDRRGSMSARVPLAEACRLVAYAPHSLSEVAIPGAAFQGW